MYKFFFKRVLDFLLALMGLVVLSPIFIIVTFSFTIVNNGKPFFFQSRPGKNERIFRIIKFKTMNDKKDTKQNLLPDVDRLTIVGKFARKVSLDEIPQLLNVIKGDMSFVGPRPLLVEYLPLYSKEQAKRHNVKPGLTGWAQVNGRNAISWEERFKLDVWYVENQSFWLDMKIIYLTIIKVFTREGINAGEGITMPPFTGNN